MSTLTIRAGAYEDRAKAGNLTTDEIKALYREVETLRRDNSAALTILRLIAYSNSQWKTRVQAVLDRIEFGTDDTAVIDAARKAIEYRNRVKG